MLSDVPSLLVIDETRDELVVEDVQLEEDIVHDFVVLYLQVHEAEGLHALHDLAVDRRRQASLLKSVEQIVHSEVDFVKEHTLSALLL